MPQPKTSEMLKKSDCSLPPPKPYPGSLYHNNMGGSLLSKEDWIKFECKKWIDEMKQSEKYDISYFSVKVHCLKGWLQKTFPKVSLKTVKDMLYHFENSLQEEDNISEKGDNESDSDHTELDDEMEDASEGGRTSPDMFDSDTEMMVDDAPLSRNDKISTIRWYVEKLDESQLDNEERVPEFVRNSKTYKSKRNEFVEHFIDQKFETSSSQEIAASHSQLPNWVQTHKYLNEKFKHRSKEELAKYRVIKNINETCKELRNNPSNDSFNQRAQIIASIICPRYGVPKGIEETRNVIDAAKIMKKDLITGNQGILKKKKRKKRELYPDAVFDFGRKFWEEKATIVEPDQHKRPERALNDGKETIPNRLQIMTDDEAYDQFKEDYQEKVKDVMKIYCNAKRQKFIKKNDSEYKRGVLEALDRLENRFPGKSWLLSIKPPQTKVNNEHSTGNCKDCYAIELNYETLLKAVRKNCKCKTDSCEGWQCTCEPEEGVTEEECTCSTVCHCDDCDDCQVRNLKFMSYKKYLMKKMNGQK